MKRTRRIRICVVGATGRMGTMVLREAVSRGFEVSGAVASPENPGLGRSLRDLAIAESDTALQPPSSLARLLRSTDVCISFASPDADLANLPQIAKSGRPFVVGTTGFTDEQRERMLRSLRGRVPTVMASNFSVGANMLFALSSTLRNLPKEFDISLLEVHHSGKTDAPSGTAETIAGIVSQARGYTRVVHGRAGKSKRSSDELEVGSFRGGGMPGDHVIYALGPYEMLKLEHLAFSRSAFSQGALVAAEWLSEGREPRVYGMLDVLGFSSET